MESLFTDLFPAADKAAWLAEVQKGLKAERNGEQTDELLRWQTSDGFTVDPYYTADDLSNLPLEQIQAAQKREPGWLNTPERQITDERADNAALVDVLARGADALVVALVNKPGTTSVQSLSRLLNGIKLSETPLFFRTDEPVSLVETLKTIAPYQLRGGLFFDPVVHWMQTGEPLASGLQRTATATQHTTDSPQFRTICASSHAFHNAGATATQEVAFLLASLADQFDQLTDSGLTIDLLAAKTILSVSVGPGYFIEIAKVRALRVLYSRFLSAYRPSVPHQPILIHGQTSTFYDAVATPYTNLLRATTEAMSAVIGGCDALTVHAYDTVLGKPASADPDFADRIARNISVLLSEESYLDKVADPSAGSYYIEQLTNQLIQAAWPLFLSVEQRGGFAQAVADGFISEAIDQAYRAKVEAVRQGKVLVGVTKFRSDTGTTIDTPTGQPDSGLLPNRRLAAEFE